MTSDNGARGEAEHGVEHGQVTVLTIAYNRTTCRVSVGAQDVPIALAQMMLHEAQIQLEFTRRQAAALELQKQMVNAAATKELFDKLAKGR